jgi:hypothetical protein
LAPAAPGAIRTLSGRAPRAPAPHLRWSPAGS